MNMGSLPPHSPTCGSGASMGWGSGGATVPEVSGSSLPPCAAANIPHGSRSYGMLQTVPERSGSLPVSEGTGHSHEATGMDARAGLGQEALQQVQGPERVPEAAAAAAASPFAALAQRAGSLFGPLKM
jgi:hypothetical protein